MKRNKTIRDLGRMVLEETLVYPLYYAMGSVFARKGIDLSDWGKSGAGTSSWKIK